MRLSNFELLRIICITLIMLMHLVVSAVSSNNTLNEILLLAINTIGNTGVTTFILISGYFGIKFSFKKLYHTLAVIWFYSIISYLFELFFLDKSVQISDIITAICPVTRNKYWFMTSYIILFCISPYLNKIKFITKEKFQSLLGILCLIFIIIPTFFYVDILNDHGKNIVNMTIVYLIGQYIHIYNLPTWFKKHNIMILSICLCCIFILNTSISFYKGYFFLWFAHDNCIFILLSSISIFLLFLKWNYKSVLINNLAQYVFPLYLTQHLLTIIFRPWCEAHNNNHAFILYLLFTSLSIWFITLIIEFTRKSLCDSIIYTISEKIEKNLSTRNLIKKYINIR